MRCFSFILAFVLWCGSAQGGQVATVCFTPGNDCAGLIVREMDAAKTYIAVQAYSFTNARIARAMVTAKRRGVDVVLLIDRGQVKQYGASTTYVSRGGVRVFLDADHTSAHNKVIIIDGQRVITGSFNFTEAAQEQNAENLVVIEGADVASQYVENFNSHLPHAVLMIPPVR